MFSMGGLLGAPAGVNSRPWYPWRGITVFLRFHKGFCLTVRFPWECLLAVAEMQVPPMVLKRLG